MEPLATVITGMSRPVYERLRHALERGRWPDGRRLSERQMQDTMQLVLAWEARNLPVEQRSGYVADVCRSEGTPAGEEGAGEAADRLIARGPGRPDA